MTSSGDSMVECELWTAQHTSLSGILSIAMFISVINHYLTMQPQQRVRTLELRIRRHSLVQIGYTTLKYVYLIDCHLLSLYPNCSTAPAAKFHQLSLHSDSSAACKYSCRMQKAVSKTKNCWSELLTELLCLSDGQKLTVTVCHYVNTDLRYF